MPYRMPLSEFVSKAHACHPEAGYGYARVVYKNALTKVTITCPEHGDFPQTPAKHIRGQGCPICGGSRRLTLAEFMAAAQARHPGAGYTYGKAAYVNNSTLVTITCPEHGDFPQTPGNHLAGHGCPACAGVKVGTADGFIVAARSVHPDANYNYGKVYYKNRRTLVIITCVRHGDFEQEPAHHLQGQGCRKCGRERQIQSATLTREEFIAAAQERHPGKGYGYAKLTYVNNHTLVTITCPEHGDFPQNPNNHLAGNGCPDCGHDRTATARRSVAGDVIARARAIHQGAGYTYAKFSYVNGTTKAVITCNSHGDFEQTPNSHLQGAGCRSCGVTRMKALQTSTRDQFVAAAKARHPFSGYNYDKFHYANFATKGTITCPVHGDFRQQPSKHLAGQGCRKCGGLVSRVCIAWLDDLGIPERNREHPIRVPGRRNPLCADGYNPATKTVYEFLGDYHHGNPDMFRPGDFDSPSCRRTYGEKHAKWLRKLSELEAAGYKVVFIWERDFRAANRGRVYSLDPTRSSRRSHPRRSGRLPRPPQDSQAGLSAEVFGSPASPTRRDAA